MPSVLQTIKPSAPARWHLFMAAAMWSAVGAGLLFAGEWWLCQLRYPTVCLLSGIGLVLGLLKARFALEKMALRTINRIETRGDGRCIGGFLSIRSWVFVIVMMVLGRALRASTTPRTILGFLYVAVGLALLIASRRLWSAWRRHRRNGQGETMKNPG